MKRASKKVRSGKTVAKKKAAKKVAPPPGWVAGEEFEPEVEQPRDLMGEMRKSLAWQVRSGLRSDKEIVQNLVDMWEGEVPAKEVRAEARRALPLARADHATEQLGWPKTTDCDRLDAAFAELDKSGVLARQDYWCCSTCGCAAIDDEMKKLARKKKAVRGYTFFHDQDTEAVVAYGGVLMLNYGSADGGEKSTAAIGKEIVRVLRKHGLKPKWNEKASERICLKMEWRRRG